MLGTTHEVVERHAGVAMRIVVVTTHERLARGATGEQRTHVIGHGGAVDADLDAVGVLGERGLFKVTHPKVQAHGVDTELLEERQIDAALEHADAHAQALEHHGVDVAEDLEAQLVRKAGVGQVALDNLLIRALRAQQRQEQHVKAVPGRPAQIGEVVLLGRELRVQRNAQAAHAGAFASQDPHRSSRWPSDTRRSCPCDSGRTCRCPRRHGRHTQNRNAWPSGRWRRTRDR